MSADCMKQNLSAYLQNLLPASCPPSPTEATLECLCNSNTFIFWYMSTLCLNCKGISFQSPLSDLTTLCPDHASIIRSSYPDSCTPYLEEVLPSPTIIQDNSNIFLSTTTSLRAANTVGARSCLSNSSTSTETTIIVSIISETPSAESQTPSLSLSTITASLLQSTQLPLPGTSSTTNTFPTSLTSTSSNSTYTNKPTPGPPIVESSSNSGLSPRQKAGIGVGAAATTIGIIFLLVVILTILRRRNRHRNSHPKNGHNNTGREVRGETDPTTTLMEMHRDDVAPHLNVGELDSFGGYGLGIMDMSDWTERIGSVPSGRIREVSVGHHEQRSSEVAVPWAAEDVRDMHDAEARLSIHHENNFAAPQDGAWPWHSAVQEAGPLMRTFSSRDGTANQPDSVSRISTTQESNPQDGELSYFTEQGSVREQGQSRTRQSSLRESNYNVAMRPRSRIYSVVDSPLLDLGEGDLSREELETLVEEERRIDEAIRENERKAHLRAGRGGTGRAS